MDRLRPLLEGCGSTVLEDVLGALLADIQDKHNISYGACALTKLVGQVKAKHHRARVAQQDLDERSFAVATGMLVKAFVKKTKTGLSTPSKIRQASVKSHVRAGGLLEMGNDILRIVATFLSRQAWEQLHFWKGVQEKGQHQEGGHHGAVTTFSFAADGTTFLSGSEDYTLKVWDAVSGQLKRTMGHSDCVESCQHSPDGSLILSACVNNMELWDAGSGKVCRTFKGHQDRVYCCCFSPDSKRILSASDDRTMKLWCPDTGRLIQTVQVGVREGIENPPICCCCFSPDGKSFVAGLNDGKLKLWNATTCELTRTFDGHSRGITDCHFSPCGTRVLTASHDGTMKVWNAATGLLLKTLVGHSNIVWHAEYSPDGKTILSASPDKTLMLWQESTGQLLRIFDCVEEVFTCSFSPDGKSILGGYDGGAMIMWGSA